MRSKFHFLNDLEVALGFTSTMMTQNYSGTTTIVPQACLRDYFRLFSDQTLNDMKRYFQRGGVAAYQHVQMLQCHYRLSNALDDCLALLSSEFNAEETENDGAPRQKRSQPTQKKISEKLTMSGGKLHFTSLGEEITPVSSVTEDDEIEKF